VTSPLNGVKCYLVDSVDEAQRFLTWLSERHPYLACDTETTGLNWSTYGPGFLRTVQFGDAQEGWTIPVRDWRGVVLDALRRYDGDLYFQNAPFDLHALDSDGLPLPAPHRVHDLKIMHSLHAPLHPHGLKNLARQHFGPTAVAGEDVLKQAFKDDGWTWETVPTNFPPYAFYAALDTVLTSRLAEHYAPLTAGEAYEREMAVQSVMFRAECKGMRIDADYTSALRDQWMTEAADLKVVLQEAGIPNPNSNAQVTDALREAGWEPEEFTETGLPQLDKTVLATLEERYPGVAVPLLRYKRLTKWTSSYLDTFLTRRDTDDRVHASINTMAARHGRMSITKPALQTLPRGPEIRDCIVPADGHELWTIDYDSMEMVMLAEFCRDPGLMDAVQEEDIHRYCASLSYGVSLGEVTKDQRQIAKNTNFSRVYGAGPKKIAATAGVTEAEIRTYMSSFDQRFPGVSQFINDLQMTAKRRHASEGKPYAMTTGGRKVEVDPDKIYTITNYLISGSCADVFKSAILRLDAAGLGDDIVVPVHDETVFEFPKGDTERVATALDAMQDLSTYSVPFTCGADGPLTRWGDKYRDRQ
jgi:DNA polymerase-1